MTEHDDPNQYESPQYDDQPRKGRGCFFWGCLTSILLVLLIVVGGGFAVYGFAKSQINKYTSEEPAELPVVEGTEEEVAELKQRVEKLQEAEDDGDADELVLTADDINKLIASSPEMRGRVFVSIVDDKLQGEVSIPTDFLPIGKGRFINAKATFDVSYENGVLIVTLEAAEVKGEPLPQEFIDALAKENLAKDLYSDPQVAEKLRRFESIDVRDNKVILKVRSAPAGEAPPQPDDLPAE